MKTPSIKNLADDTGKTDVADSDEEFAEEDDLEDLDEDLDVEGAEGGGEEPDESY